LRYDDKSLKEKVVMICKSYSTETHNQSWKYMFHTYMRFINIIYHYKMLYYSRGLLVDT